MKALMGELAKKIRKDERGSEELSSFVVDSGSDFTVITLSNGTKYKVTRKRPSRSTQDSVTA